MILKNCLSSFIHVFGLVWITLSATVSSAQEGKPEFVKDIKPIFESHCLTCHGPIEKEDQENDFRIDDREDALDFIGTDGSEDSDLFLLLISDDEDEIMPPPEHGKLTPKEISLVKAWIDQGADWPEGVELVDAGKPAGVDEGNPDEPETAGDSQDVEKEDVTKDDAAPVLTADKKLQQIFNATGSLHPAAVHLPIGLLLASGLFALFSLRGNFVMSDCAYYCLWLGTIGAIAACLSGWWYSPMEHRGTVVEFWDVFDQTHPVFWHRTGGLIVTAVALLLALFATGARNRDPDDGMLWKLGLILLAGGIGWVGHTGGEMAYPGQYKDLNAIYERMIGGELFDTKANGKKDDAAQAESDNVGKSSDESGTKPDAD